MKVQSIGTNHYNPAIRGNRTETNKLCKYAITSLIASSSLFMLSNAIDTIKPNESVNSFVDMIASVLAIFGTMTGISGMEKNKNSKSGEY